MNNQHANLRGYRLKGTRYCWSFVVVSSQDNHEKTIRVLMKRTGWFQRTLLSTEVIVNTQNGNVPKALKAAMDELLSTDTAQGIFSEHELSINKKKE